MKVEADLHIHSCLSPCGDLSMSPAAIAEQAKNVGLNLIALSDHNTALNCPAFSSACAIFKIACLFGIEATTKEEAHVLCLFESVDTSLKFGEMLYEKLPDHVHDADAFGDQVYVDDQENILGEVEKSLFGAVDISVEKMLDIVHSLGGLFIPAHADRQAFSLPSQLGFLPPLPYDAVESTKLPCPVSVNNKPIIQNSDAHFINDIGKRRTIMDLDAPDFPSLADWMRRER